MRSRLDKFLSSWVSKKLSVFVVATILALSGKLTSSDWVTVSVVYIGTQGALDFAKALKNNIG